MSRKKQQIVLPV